MVRNAAPTVLVCASLIVAIAGCQTQSGPEAAPAPRPQPDTQPVGAETDETGGLNAAAQRLASGDVVGAQALAAALALREAAGELSPGERFRWRLLEANIALALEDLPRARSQLQAAVPPDARARTWATLLAARIDAAAGRPAQAAGRLARLRPAALENPAAVVATLWDYGRRIPPHGIAAHIEAAAGAERAWWRLVLAHNEALTPRQQRQAWLSWRSAHARHVAASAEPPLRDATSMPGRIALFLPLSGALGPAALAVRDGFIAAYLASAPPPSQSIRVYDTAAQPLEDLYEQALADDAALIVGPLGKENAQRLWALDPSTPVLALNTVPTATSRAQTGQRIQFALAAEDDGRAIAQRLKADGVRRVVLFRAGQWSGRAAAALRAHLDASTEVVAATLLSDIREVTAAVAEALTVTASNARHQDVAQHFRTDVKFTTRRRRDIDAVVALLEADYLASLQPALAFHFASELPVYISSQGLRDAPAAGFDGARVCGMPWRLHPPPLKAELQGPFADVGGALEALFAFGVDAFRIANRLADVNASTPIAGAVGLLTLGEDGVVRRELAWAEVRDGAFEPLR